MAAELERNRTLNAVRFRIAPVLTKEGDDADDRDPSKLALHVQKIIEKTSIHLYNIIKEITYTVTNTCFL